MAKWPKVGKILNAIVKVLNFIIPLGKAYGWWKNRNAIPEIVPKMGDPRDRRD